MGDSNVPKELRKILDAPPPFRRPLTSRVPRSTVMQHSPRMVTCEAVLNEERKKRRSVPVPRFPKNAHGHTMCWRLAVGGWRLAVGDWRLVAVDGG